MSELFIFLNVHFSQQDKKPLKFLPGGQLPPWVKSLKLKYNRAKCSISGKAGDESLKALCKCYLQPHYHSRYSLNPKQGSGMMYLAGLEILVLGTSTVGNGDTRKGPKSNRGQRSFHMVVFTCVHVTSYLCLSVIKKCVTSFHIIVPQSISSTVSLSNLCQEDTS